MAARSAVPVAILRDARKSALLRMSPSAVPRLAGWARRSAPLPTLRWLRHSSKREHVDHGARIGVFERRRFGGSVPLRAGCNSDILLAVDRVADRRRHDAATGVEPPQLFQGLAVVGD